MNKYLPKKNNRFLYKQLVKINDLKNYPEKWFSLVMHTHIDDLLEADPRAAKYGAQEVEQNLVKLTNGFALQCHRYGINPEGYWNFVIENNEVAIYRSSDQEKLALIIVSSDVNNISSLDELINK